MYDIIDEPVPRTPSESRLEDNQTPKMELPLLVWIDDNPINNISEVAHARELGINVIQLTSTALAKAWIEEHSGQ